MTRIVVDAMGSDNFPGPDVEGAVMAAREYGVEVILVGDEAKVKPVLDKQDLQGLKVRLVHAPEMLTMNDKGMALALKARRANAKNSMAVGIDLVKNGEADVFVTAGNTGACVATSYFRLGTIPGVDLPALVGHFPQQPGPAWCSILAPIRIASRSTCSSLRSWAVCTRKKFAASKRPGLA